ncbi:MAG: OmpH family outer membrane protein [Alistipes senegalensis]
MDAYNTAISDLDFRLAKQYQEQVDAKFNEVETLYNYYMAQKASLSASASRQVRESADPGPREKEAQEFQGEPFRTGRRPDEKRVELIYPIQKRVFAAIEAYAGQVGRRVTWCSIRRTIPRCSTTTRRWSGRSSVIEALKRNRHQNN